MESKVSCAIRFLYLIIDKTCSSKVLLNLCESITFQKDEQGLLELQEYLEARLLLLKHIPVCRIAIIATALPSRITTDMK